MIWDFKEKEIETFSWCKDCVIKELKSIVGAYNKTVEKREKNDRQNITK